MNDFPLTVRMLLPQEAQDDALVLELTHLVNDVYARSEAGLWADGAARTTTGEITELISTGQIAVARLGERVVGSVRIHQLDRATGEFGMLVAAQHVRGSGVGRALVAFAEHWATENGFEELQLEVLAPRGWSHPSKEFLRAWYPRIGFEQIRYGRFEESYPALAQKLATPCDFIVYRKTIA